MGNVVDDNALDTLFRKARTHFKWLPRPIEDQTLHELYELLKWAPTSANAAPARFAFLKSREAKERLRPALAPLNIEKTMTAPVTVIIAYDLKFYEQLPKLFPHNPGMAKLFEGNAEMVEVTAKRNSSLQGAYLIMAARAGTRLRTDVGVRSRESGRRVLRRREAMLRLRSGILPRRAREDDLPVQSRIRRRVCAETAAAAPRVLRSLLDPVSRPTGTAPR